MEQILIIEDDTDINNLIRDHGKNPQCTPSTPPVFAMHSRKNILRITMRYFVYGVLVINNRFIHMF